MKKLLMVLIALLLCLTAGFAMAEEIRLDLVEMENGLIFPVPVEWTQVELSQQEMEEGYLLMMLEEDTARCMLVTADEIGIGATNQDIANSLAADGGYGMVSVVDAGEMEVVLYSLSDQTIIGYYFTDGEGTMYNFAFLNANDEPLTGDTALLQMAQQCMQNTAMADGELSVSLNDMEDPASGIPLTEYGAGSLVFALPADWASVELSEQEIADGSLVMLTDRDSGYAALVMANEIGKEFTNALLADTLGQDPEYAMARLVTNAHGQELVQYLTADQTVGGYAVMDADGWMYIFYFSGQTPVTQDALLTQLVSDCMDRVYLEE